MRPSESVPPQSTMLILHPVLALTGVVQAIGGALLTSMAARFHLAYRQSGLLFLWFFYVYAPQVC